MCRMSMTFSSRSETGVVPGVDPRLVTVFHDELARISRTSAAKMAETALALGDAGATATHGVPITAFGRRPLTETFFGA